MLLQVRQQLAEQLSVSRSLTHKTQDTESTDDEADDTTNIPDLTLAQDPMNPWMMKSTDKSNIDAEFNFGYKKYLKAKLNKQKDSDSDEENSEPGHNQKVESSLRLLKESVKKISGMNNSKEAMKKETKSDEVTIIDNGIITPKNVTEHNKSQMKPTTVKKVSKKTIATSNWVVEEIDLKVQASKVPVEEDISTVFDQFENKVVGKVEKKLKKLRKQISRMDKQSKKQPKGEQKADEKQEPDNLEYFKFKNQNPKAQIDEELIETYKGTDNVKDKDPSTFNLLSSTENPSQETMHVDIDPNRFIEVKPKYLNTAVSKGENDIDDLDDDDEQVVPKVDIEEVFEEDDVVDSFRQEKEDERNNDKPEDVDLTLPGWGSWGGKGVKVTKRKRNRFIGKPPPKVPRRDDNKGDIIINEFKNPKLSAHKVSNLPFPFTSVKEYEASIRTPLGNTFIPETAHKKLIRPSVITKAGAVIEPIDEDELLVKKNRNFKNESILRFVTKQ